MTTQPQISGNIPRFSLKEFIKVRPWKRGGRGGVVAYRHKSGYFETRKNTAPPSSLPFFLAENRHCLKKVLAKIRLFLR
jgi:hypothetical protein